MKLAVAWKSLVVAASLSLVAFFYYPPSVAQQEVSKAVTDAQSWHLRAQGKIGAQSIGIDLVKHQGELFFRISYLPIKLLNNQWITLGKSNHLFSHLLFTKRLTTWRELFLRQEKYAFEWDEEAAKLISGIQNQDGVLLFDKRSSRPLEFSAGRFKSVLEYQDQFFGEVVAAPRSLSEVVSQLQELNGLRNGNPRALSQLGSGSPDTRAFTSDFDHDGVSDAMEIFWGTDPANPDSDNDGHLDGDEIRRGYNPTGEGKLTN